VHLRSLRLRGFKSFPDPVEIRLEPGVAVVVGPNGSGKSNVSDALLWATGTLAPSELRAEKPDDVLFAGSVGRARADFCEVELVFDNEDGALAELPFAEVSLARRLHRGGEGQYLLNGTTVRRIDLVELLSEVGLATGASIIGQGRVEEILASKPEERRALLEEAAGLGRFKRRKHRAELKLARVAAQVERARDLEAEVRKRLRPLALQATAAERAEKLGGEIAGLEARIAELELAGHEERRVAVDERRTAAQLERRRVEARLEDVLTERAGAEDELADAAGRREAATAALYRLRSATERLALRREAAEALAASFEAALEHVVAGPAPEELEEARAAVAAAAAAREREHRLRAAGERLSLGAERAQALLADVRVELAAAEEAAALQPARLEAEAAATATAARDAVSLRDTLAEQAAVARNRLEALDRALAEREGLAPAARALAERGERLALSLVDPEEGGEKAIAAALGPRASALVADDPESALALVEKARAEGLGNVVVLLSDRAERLLQSVDVVSLEVLLRSDRLAVTADGHGFDPERGELWYAGETAEALLLELQTRRKALGAEADQLARDLEDANVAAGRRATEAAEAKSALDAVPARLRRRFADPALLGRVARGAERLDEVLQAAARRAGDRGPTADVETATVRLRELEARARAAARRDPAKLLALAALARRLGAALETDTQRRFEPALTARADAGGARTRDLAAKLRNLGAAEAELRRTQTEASERAAALDVERAQIDAAAAEARRRLEAAEAEPAEGDDRDALSERVDRLRARREQLGRVNPLAKEEYEAEKERLDQLTTQRVDLDTSLAELEKLRADLAETVETRFAETFEAVARNFHEVAGVLFPGGEGRLRLTEPDAEDEDGEHGIEVELRPAGKKVTRLSLLSGGEKALTAIAFLFAVFLARPSPFYLLDEVEAALDDTNIGRFVDLLRRFSDRAQFVVITHQKRTMEAADTLYGVTMGGDGVSQIVSRRTPRDDRAASAA
jgi:chromosome segregation protein